MKGKRINAVIGVFAALPMLAAGFIMGPLHSYAAQSGTVPTDGLVAAYDFTDGKGATVTDTTGKGHNGTVRGVADWGKGVLNFTGNTNVALPADVLQGAGAVTVSVQAKPDAQALNRNNFLFNIGGKGTSQNGGTGQFFVSTNNHKATITKTNWQGEQNASSPSTFKTDWQSIIATLAPNQGGATSTLTLYVDGKQVAQNTSSQANFADLKDFSKTAIGDSAYDEDANFTGAISNVRLYNRAVSAQEAQSIAQADATEVAEEAKDSDTGGSATEPETPVEPIDAHGYLWLHFGATDYEKVYFGYSENGVDWQKLNNNKPVMQLDNGTKGLRDPHILKLQQPDNQGNKYVMLGTDLHAEGSAPGGSWDQINASKYLVVAKSKDLVNWTRPELVSTGLEGKVGNAWAPEAIYDPQTKDYAVYWASRDLTTGDTTALKVYKAHTADFTSFNNPQIWIDQSSANMHNIIDTTIVQGDDGDYYRFSTSDWYTVIDTASSLDGKWTRLVERDSDINNGKSIVTGDTVISTSNSGLSNHIEGLTVYQLPNGKWMVMGDSQGYAGWSIDRLSDIKKGKTFTKAATSFDQRFRHGTVMPLTADEQAAVLEAYGAKLVVPVEPDEQGAGPIAQYTFEDSKGTDSIGKYDLVFHGNAKVTADTTDTERSPQSKVLQLDGSNGTYAQFPSEIFDRRNKLTITMDVTSQINANQFTFTFGQDSNVYYFLKYNNSGELGSRITTNSYQHEAAANTRLSGNGAWHRVTIVLDDTTMKVYVDGVLSVQNEDTGITVTQLGMDLNAFLGKSLYPDPYFKGAFDNITIWNRALSSDEIAQHDNAPMIVGATVGTVPTDDQAADLRGTDNHSAVRTVVDQQTHTITSAVNRRADITAVPVSLTAGWQGVSISVDGKPFDNGTPLDMSKDHTVTATLSDATASDKTEQWTLKAATVSNNPVLPGQYADPDIDYFDGKFWIYPTTDGFSGWSGNYFHAFSSPDLQNWTDEGVILDVNREHQPTTDGNENTAISPWSVGSAWAPTIEKKHGKYYFYYCAKFPNGESAIGVAVADNPAGPYKATEQPLVTRSMEGVSVGQAIDPSIFTDTDGTSYILYGNGSAAIAQLGDDMTSIVPGTVKRVNGLRDFRESVVVSVHDGKYHWTWSCDDAGSPNYHVNYGVSDSLRNADGSFGPTTYVRTLIEKDSSLGIQGTAHQSDVHVTDADGKERWILAYHRHYTPLGVFSSGLGYHRETALDELHFDAQGNFATVKPSDEGIGAIRMADGEKLAQAIQAAGAIGAENDGYTDASWDTFVAARTAATSEYERLQNRGAAQVAVDQAAQDLVTAFAALKKVDAGDNTGADGSTGTDGSTEEPGKDEGPQTDPSDQPSGETGDANDNSGDQRGDANDNSHDGTQYNSESSHTQLQHASHASLVSTGVSIIAIAVILLCSIAIGIALISARGRA